ncbi:MAG: RsmE family RNA methyltransferase [Prevotella sp.]
MKEIRTFYVPNAIAQSELPVEEAAHAIKVLRLNCDDRIVLIDGEGNAYNAVITACNRKKCLYRITESISQSANRYAPYNIAVAPTKMMERMEWFAEKATEIGINRITFLDGQNSERHIVKTDRIERIVISAMKQSHKSYKPMVDEMMSFRQCMASALPGKKYIAHCHDEIPREYLFDVLHTQHPAEPMTVFIGPEGDFSVEEVKAAIDNGFISVHLGESRLRTETAALSALMMMHLCSSERGQR